MLEVEKILVATVGPAALRGLGGQQQGGISSGKPREDQTSGSASHSSNKQEESQCWLCKSLALAVRERKESFSPPPPTSQVTPCPRDKPEYGPPKSPTTCWEQRTWRLIILFLGEQPGREPRVTTVLMGNSRNSPR